MIEKAITIIYQEPRILLGLEKKENGKYTGFGGGLKKAESLEDCARRETLEEAGIEIINPKKIGEILFKFDNGEQDHKVHFFRTELVVGNPIESDEMKPEWFHVNNLPYDKMWEDNQYWMPYLLNNKKFEGNFWFNKDNKVRNYFLRERGKVN